MSVTSRNEGANAPSYPTARSEFFAEDVFQSSNSSRSKHRRGAEPRRHHRDDDGSPRYRHAARFPRAGRLWRVPRQRRLCPADGHRAVFSAAKRVQGLPRLARLPHPRGPQARSLGSPQVGLLGAPGCVHLTWPLSFNSQQYTHRDIGL